MSLEQKRLQLPTKFSDVVVGLTNPGWQTVPEPWSSGCGRGALMPTSICLSVCLSSAQFQHRRLTWIRQRASLLVLMLGTGMVSIREGRYILFHVVLFLSVSVCSANLRNLQYRLSHNLTFSRFSMFVMLLMWCFQCLSVTLLRSVSCVFTIKIGLDWIYSY